MGDRCAQRGVGRHLGHQPGARPGRVRDSPAHPGEGEHHSAGMAPAPRGYEALSWAEQSVSRGRARKRDVLSWRPMAGGGGADPGRAIRARRPARGGSGIPRNGLSALGEDRALAACRRRGDRDLRRPAEPAGGGHGDDVRSGPNDLERLHRGGGLDVPSGPGGRAWAAPSGRGDGTIDFPGAGGRAELGRRRSRSDATAPCSARPNYAPPRSGSPANNPLIRLDIHGQHPREDEADGNHFEQCATSLERRAARRQRPGPRVRLFPQASRLDQSRRGG